MYSYDINPQGSPISEPSAATLLPGSTLDGTDYVDYNNVADKAVSLLIQKPSVKFLSPTPHGHPQTLHPETEAATFAEGASWTFFG